MEIAQKSTQMAKLADKMTEGSVTMRQDTQSNPKDKLECDLNDKENVVFQTFPNKDLVSNVKDECDSKINVQERCRVAKISGSPKGYSAKAEVVCTPPNKKPLRELPAHQNTGHDFAAGKRKKEASPQYRSARREVTRHSNPSQSKQSLHCHRASEKVGTKHGYLQSPKEKSQANNDAPEDNSNMMVIDIGRLCRELCQTLKEPKLPLMRRALDTLGVSAVEDLLQDVDKVEISGGQMTADGDRRRTPGGVFWNLLKQRATKEEYDHIFETEKELQKQRARRRQARRNQVRLEARKDRDSASPSLLRSSEDGSRSPVVATSPSEKASPIDPRNKAGKRFGIEPTDQQDGVGIVKDKSNSQFIRLTTPDKLADDLRDNWVMVVSSSTRSSMSACSDLDREAASPESVNLSTIASPASRTDYSDFSDLADTITPQVEKKPSTSTLVPAGIAVEESRRSKRVTMNPDASMEALKRQLSFADVVMSQKK